MLEFKLMIATTLKAFYLMTYNILPDQYSYKVLD
jgi:hypothetical protein